MNHSERMELLGEIIDVFEDWLEEKGITNKDIKCEDRDQAIEDGEAEEDLAIVYGEDYDFLTGSIEEILIDFGLLDLEEDWI